MMDLDLNEPPQGDLRLDGRRPTELRKINLRLGVFGQADGSAYVEQGKTKVLAAIYGPHQPRGSAARSTTKTTKGIINCQYSTAVFSFGAGERKKRPRGDRKSQERALQLRHAMEAIIQLDLIARSQIDIFVEILQVDGSEFCVAVNAATLALIDAGIPIKLNIRKIKWDNGRGGLSVGFGSTPLACGFDSRLALWKSFGPVLLEKKVL
ncbi:exosome complex component RRP41-like [Belonocnema kinseyi]|uniref:exosome complex component RRP41-like n=1 Tax=Belonocnema kinseyi TaxID=2817044 RepID=UPI00143DC33D|nr:exosome complex component RRP41-like [Belonocnema kinseyi]